VIYTNTKSYTDEASIAETPQESQYTCSQA
jgi:hypothetical protein